MEDQEREAAIDAEQHDELDLCLGLRLFPSRLNLQISSPKIPAQKSSHLSIPSWGHGGSRSQQEPDRKRREDKRKLEANVSNEKRRALERESDFSERPNGHTIGIEVDVAATPFFVRSSGGFDSFQPVIGGGSVSNCCSKEGSTGVSDYQSTSGSQDAGGSNSDDGSYSGHSRGLNHTNNKDCSPSSSDKQIRTSHHDSEPSTPQPNGSAPCNSSKRKPDCSFSTGQTELSQTVKEVPITMKTSTSSQMNPCYLNRNSNVQAKIQSPSKVVEIGRPPKPEAQPTHEAMTQMPCVATTGNGPNGKRITGFLYKYTKLEVSIVCVCHGTSFSPAGFVEHAGGVGIENPLRHITIAPSVFK